MTKPRRIYLLDTKHLNPETIAVAFAKTSRSPDSFDDIAAELSDDRAADFHEKWVVGYGHSSVAEHAVLHIAVENVSRLAIECIESNRLASYTEKSTRYQIWDEDSFYLPVEIKGSIVEKKFSETCKFLFKEYLAAFDKVGDYFRKIKNRNTDETDRAYEIRIRSCTADVCRYLLPASSLANVGISINARALEHMLRKMLSHPLNEVREVGKQIKKVSLEIVPTLVKYADRNEYLVQIADETTKTLSPNNTRNQSDDSWFQCIDFDKDGERKILASLVYRFSNVSFLEAHEYISRLPDSELIILAQSLLGKLGKHDIPVREMEYARISFDLFIDQGAYFEFKRHRMMTQTVKPFDPTLGYAIPRVIKEVGLLENYKNAMEKVEDTYLIINEIQPHAASYILPNGFNRRVLVTMNLRSALHFLKLRSASNAHFAMRRVAQRIAEEIRKNYPLFAQYFSFGENETSKTLDTDFFYSTYH